MTLIVAPNLDNSETPGVTATAYYPDQLIGGDLKLVTDSVTITGGADLLRGSVLGQVTQGAPGAAVATGGNTGNGTITAISAGSKLRTGGYTIRYTSATAFTVTDPNGVQLTSGVNGVYTDAQLTFTATAGGTPFVAGDSFTITVAAGSGAYKLCAAAATDGSQSPAAILVDTALASGGDVNAGVYLMGEFNLNALIFGAGMTAAIAKPILAPLNIYLKTSVSAADPT